MTRPVAKLILFSVLLSFVTNLTIANVPYLFFGYGLSALAILTIGLTLEPKWAILTFLAGDVSAVSLIGFTGSAFTLVVVAAVVVRTLQVFILSKLKKRMGAVGASLLTVLFGTTVATILAIAYFGGDGLSSSLAFFDAAFIPSAYLISKAARGGRGGALLGAGVLTATFGLFLSASHYWIPTGTLASLILLALGGYLFRRAGSVPKYAPAFLLLAIVIAPLTLATAPTSLSYNGRIAFYPLSPVSLLRSQWTQTNSSASCMQGNIAGAGTVQNGVWGPERLRMIVTCVTVTGTVVGLEPTSGPSNDNDYGIDLRIDPQFMQMLSIGNLVLEGGHLHVEVVPSAQPALQSVLSTLKPGDRVLIVGSFVIDTDHGMGAEVHPAWSIRITAQG